MATNYSPKIVTDRLVLCLDAANVKSYPGSGTVWKDLSGNGNDAHLTGTYGHVSGESFVFNSGAQLDGDGRATVDFGSVGTSSPYTIECVFRINRYKFLSSTSNISAQLFSSGRTPGNFDEAFYLGRNGASDEVVGAGYSWYDANHADGPGGGADQVFTDIIYHATVTIDNPGAVNFYQNGQFLVTDTTTASNLKLDNTWSVSNQPPGNDFGVDSNFYIVRAYNRILSVDEIQKNFNAVRGRYGI
jgi:hypothetical protein